MVELPLVADLKVEIEEYGATTRVGENLQSAIDVLEHQAARIAALEAQLAERVKVKPLDNATQQKLREALRFAASRSVLSSEDERRILSTLEATPPAPKVTEAMVESGCKAFLAEYGDPSAEWHHYRREVTAALTAAQESDQ